MSVALVRIRISSGVFGIAGTGLSWNCLPIISSLLHGSRPGSRELCRVTRRRNWSRQPSAGKFTRRYFTCWVVSCPCLGEGGYLGEKTRSKALRWLLWAATHAMGWGVCSGALLEHPPAEWAVLQGFVMFIYLPWQACRWSQPGGSAPLLCHRHSLIWDPLRWVELQRL